MSYLSDDADLKIGFSERYQQSKSGKSPYFKFNQDEDEPEHNIENDEEEPTSSPPRVNPFSKFAFGTPDRIRSRNQPDLNPKPGRSPLGKRKPAFDISDGEERLYRPFKAKRGISTSPAKSSPRKVRIYEGLQGLDDCLELGLDIIFCGINPGKQSAEIGHHYGNPNNHFWSCLHESGLTSRRLDPREDASLPKYFSAGLTNLTDRPTIEQSELSKAEQVAGVPKFLDKVARYRPRILCFVGLGIADIVKSAAEFVGSSEAARGEAKAKAAVGLQHYKMVHAGSSEIHETLFYAVSSTSGRVVRYQKTDKILQFKELREFLTRVKAGTVDTSYMLSILSSNHITR